MLTGQNGSYGSEAPRSFVREDHPASSIEKLMVVCDEASRQASRLESLHAEGLVSEAELSKARAAEELARNELREALRGGVYSGLQILLDDVRLLEKDTVRITMRAVHSRDLRSVFYRRALKVAGLEQGAVWRPGGIVSIRSDGRIVGRPLTKWISFPPHGESADTEFELEGEPADVTIRLEI